MVHGASDVGAGRERDAIEHRITVEGAPAAVFEYPASGAPIARVLLVHGFRGDHHGLDAVARALTSFGVEVHSPDLPGFGLTPPLPGRVHDLDLYAGWVTRLARELELTEHDAVIGHSFGSIVVAAACASGLEGPRVALINPIAKPALEGPNAIGTWFAERFYALGAALPERFGGPLLRARIITDIMSLMMTKTRDPKVRAFIRDEHRARFSGFAERQSLLEAFRASVSHNVADFADTLPSGVLLIAAERDEITPVEAEEALAKRLRGAELVVLPGVGHLIHYERPMQATNLIARWLGASSTPLRTGHVR